MPIPLPPACRARLSVVTDVVEIAADGVRRRQPGAGFSVRERAQLLLLARGVAEAKLPFVGKGERLQTAALPAVSEQVQDLGSAASPASELALEEADLIVSAGNGVSNVPGFLVLAEALGAAVGMPCVAVDDGRFTRDKQVGATGKTVQASAYIAGHIRCGTASARHQVLPPCDCGEPGCCGPHDQACRPQHHRRLPVPSSVRLNDLVRVSARRSSNENSRPGCPRRTSGHPCAG
jgi:hypothetical protein